MIHIVAVFLTWSLLLSETQSKLSGADAKSKTPRGPNPLNNDIEFEQNICRTVYCDEYEECVVDDDYVAKCQCKSCSDEEHASSSMDKQVCSTGRKTFLSLCHLEREACLTKTDIRIDHFGKCLPRDIPKLPSTTTSADTVVLTVATQKPKPTPIVCRLDPELIKFEFGAQANTKSINHSNQQTMTSKGLEMGLAKLIFDTYDKDGNKLLSRNELLVVQEERTKGKLLERFMNLNKGCSWEKVLFPAADSNFDRMISADELLSFLSIPPFAFNISLFEKYHKVPLNSQYQIMCDIQVNHPFAKILWLRRNNILNPNQIDGITISNDGKSLYLTPASYFHSGVFDCRPSVSSNMSDFMEQRHIILIESKHRVAIEPQFLLQKTGESGRFVCQVEQPTDRLSISWFRNEEQILSAQNKTILQLSDLKPQDTASYMCEVLDQDNKSSASATLVVRDQYDKAETIYKNAKSRFSDNGKIVALGHQGVAFYEKFDCSLRKAIAAYHPLKKSQSGFLCGSERKCLWSKAVITDNGACLFATLMGEKFLIKFDVQKAAIVEIMKLDFEVDQLAINSKYDVLLVSGQRNASVDVNHSGINLFLMSHASNVSSKIFLAPAQFTTTIFDQVHKFFIPGEGSMNFGYFVPVRNRYFLHQIDLTMGGSNVTIDLSPFKCQPEHITFAQLRSLLIVKCARDKNVSTDLFKTSRLIIDYLTNAIVEHSGSIKGDPKLSPDEKFLFTYDQPSQTLVVEKFNDRGDLVLSNTFDLSIDGKNWLIYPDILLSQWNIIALSENQQYLLMFRVNKPEVKVLHHIEAGNPDAGGRNVFKIGNDQILMSSSVGLKLFSIFNFSTPVCSTKSQEDATFAFMT